MNPPIQRQMAFEGWRSGKRGQETKLLLRGCDECGGALKAFAEGKSSRLIASPACGKELCINVNHIPEARGARWLSSEIVGASLMGSTAALGSTTRR
jgi:hypothetical protein